MLHRKDFKAIAEILREVNENCFGENPSDILSTVRENLADYLSTTNPNFNRDKFLVACGVN